MGEIWIQNQTLAYFVFDLSLNFLFSLSFNLYIFFLNVIFTKERHPGPPNSAGVFPTHRHVKNPCGFQKVDALPLLLLLAQ